MAENTEETPENIQEEVEAAATDEAVEAEAPAPARTRGGGATRRERLEARRADRRAAAGRRKSRTPEERAAERAERQAAAGKRPSRTPEERDAERRERRAALAKQRRAYRQRLKAKKAERRAAEPPREPDHALEHGSGRAKVRQGVVVSEKGDKTITVAIDMVRRHKRYHKIMRSTVKLYAHDERNDAHEGDTVRVQECRPMSRSKRWRLVDVVERAR